jgi:hypothetical protein
MIKSSLSLWLKPMPTKSVNIDDRIPEYLIGDKLRLQIIMNLVSNGQVQKHVNLAKVENNFIFLELKFKIMELELTL